MTTAFQVCYCNNDGHVTGTLELAFRNVMYRLIGSLNDRTELGTDNYAPELARVGGAGCLAHRIRCEAEHRGRSKISIVEHLLYGSASDSSAVDFYSFDDFDPSYLVQKSLYETATGDVMPLELIADNLAAEITTGVRTARHLHESDAAFVSRLRRWQERLGGVSVIPAEGNPSEILWGLPRLCADKFLAVARQAFPEAALAT